MTDHDVQGTATPASSAGTCAAQHGDEQTGGVGESAANPAWLGVPTFVIGSVASIFWIAASWISFPMVGARTRCCPGGRVLRDDERLGRAAARRRDPVRRRHGRRVGSHGAADGSPPARRAVTTSRARENRGPVKVP